MNGWKSTEWQEKVKGKPVRYYIRAEIEEIIKEENIDRSRFHEAPKSEYEKIIRKYYHTFFNYEKYPFNGKLSEDKLLCFHSRLRRGTPIYLRSDWIGYINTISALIPENRREQPFRLILQESWVYEGYIPEITAVLTETDGALHDFVVVSKTFDLVIANSDDGECIFTVSE